MNPKIINYGTPEYFKLETVADMLTAFSPNEAQYEVNDVYFDFGQRWMWTTILRNGYKECQILCPRDWEKIITANSPTELVDAFNTIVNDKYFGDKEKEN